MKTFNKGDRCSWNSEAGRVTGIVTEVHTAPFQINGYTKHATKDNPVYALKSEISEHVAYHFAAALTKLSKVV